METPARFTFSPDGNTKVFPIPVTMKGDNYVRIDIDGVILNDRTKFDLVNNAVVFVNISDVPSGSQLDVLVVQTDEGIANLGNVNSVDLVASNITDVLAVANSIASVNTTATNITSVNNVSTNMASVTDAVNQATAAATSAAAALVSENAAEASELAAAASKNAAATSATNAATSASNASTSASAASTSQTAAANSATAAATSATAADGYATAASGYADAGLLAMNTTIAAKNAAETAETNAAASATAAASSEAGVAADALAATNAASAAATSETNAATSKTNAAASETAAATSATSAASSATSAASSATEAAASATAAASSASLADSDAAAADAYASAALTSATNASESANTATQQAALAAGSAASAATSATAAAASATSANNDKLAAQAAATSATNTAAALTGFDLEAIAASKAVTAVDVFVYDTSKDSDGGAWRKRTQHTSWYNETLNTATRGSRREFPAVAVIVAESNKVTIYDGDDPALPMWMVFNQTISPSAGFDWFRSGRNVSCITALNGLVAFGTNTVSNNGLCEANFILDNLRRVSVSFAAEAGTGKSVLNRNANTDLPTRISIALVSQTVNDVAMTVLPDAPIDPATGLPVPTIAVATAGGVSVIKDDGTVVSDNHPVSVQRIGISGSDLLSYIQTSTGYVAVRQNFYTRTGVSVDNFGLSSGGEVFYRHNSVPALFPVQANNAILKFDGKDFGFNQGLFRLHEDQNTPSKGMVAYTTSSYNTGWMNGNIKGAFLSSTDTASLVGSGELVTNGTFDTDTSGWTAENGSTLSVVSGALRVSQTTTDYGRAEQVLSAVVGKTYVLSVDLAGGTGAARVTVAESPTSGKNLYVGSVLTAPQTVTATFVATTTTPAVRITNDTNADNTYYDFDNISVKLADPDRSVNNKGLIVNGTVTRSPVATGAELVAYSGFSASNYLEQPYNSALDFGTGDFCVMGWVNVPDAVSSFRSFERNNLASPDVTKRIVVNVTGGLVGAYAGSTAITSAVTAGVWNYVAAVRSGGVFYLYVNGVQKASQTNTLDLSLSSAITRLGSGVQYAGANHSLALLRISATAPTAQQIARIYQDERPLFQENAACTIAGTSDAVTALAHDSTTNLLHVGSSYGRSVFQGLRRVDAVAGAVGTAISAENGLVVSE